MKTEIKKHKNRVYLFVNDKKTKLLPIKYWNINDEKFADLLTDIDKLRLSPTERFLAEWFNYLNDLKGNNIHIFNFIKNTYPLEAFKVNVKFGNDRYEIKLKNNVFVKVSECLYTLSPIKKTKHSNS